eukprot:g80862.t1
MGEPEELVEGVGEINLNPATAGFWKPWGEVEEKAPAEMKNPRLVRAPAVVLFRVFCALGLLSPTCPYTSRNSIKRPRLRDFRWKMEGGSAPTTRRSKGGPFAPIQAGIPSKGPDCEISGGKGI